MPDSKNLSIIIVNYNSAAYLGGCISSVRERIGGKTDWEAIIVNSDGREDIGELEKEFFEVKIINHKKNVGFGSGINIGVKEARGKYLLFLNPDTRIASDNIGSVLKCFSKDDSVGIIGAKIVDGMGNARSWIAGQDITFLNLIKNNLQLGESKKVWKSPEKAECDWVAGTAMFIKKGLIEALGGFDGKFFMYFEDMDLCRRAKFLGQKTVFFPDFRVFHHGGKSYADNRLQKKHYYDSMEYYFKKHRNFLEVYLVKAIRKIFFS